jgi:hypothetical protein
MTPKQAAAHLLLATLKQGAPHPSKRSAEDLTTALNMRISEEKRAKILEFVAKIEAPYIERLQRIGGEDEQVAAPSAQSTT